VTSNPDFKLVISFNVKNSKTVPDRAIITMANEQKVVYGLSNGGIFNDLEQPLTQFSRSRCNYFDAEYLING